MSKIISLKASNFMSLKAVEIYPDGNMVQICGKNGAGKSSVLNAITAALGGVDTTKLPEPVRIGQEKAEIILETEDLIVTRRFTVSGKTSLIVKALNGATFSAGQSKVDALLGKLSLDPFAFTQLDPKKQRAQLLELVDLPFDLAALDAERKKLEDERRDIGRAGNAIGDVLVDANLPATETSAGEIIASIRAAEEARRERSEAEGALQIAAENVARIKAEIENLLGDLANWESTLHTRGAVVKNLPKQLDTTVLEQQLSEVEGVNAAVRVNNAARAQKAKQTALRDDYNALTAKLAAIDKTKADGLAAAKFPIDGLGFGADGVTFNKVPFIQVNSGIQLETSMALAAALNPGLRVLRIAEGSLLDDDAKARVAAFAKKRDFQVWMEIVGHGDGTGIIIEDGEVA